MFDLFDGLVERGIASAENAIVLVAIVMIVVVWATSRRIGAAIAAVLFGAFMVWAVQNLDSIQERIGEDLDPQGAPTQLLDTDV